jgi:hypothetical protein
MAAKIPPPKAVRDLLEGLLGRDVEVAPADPLAVGFYAALAVYQTDAGRMSAVVGTDLALAAYLGTSVALIPPGGAEAILEDKALSATALENVGEVLNVFASVLNEYSDEHTRLIGTYRGQLDAPSDALTLVGTLGNRLDLKVTVSKYGTGTLSVVLTF